MSYGPGRLKRTFDSQCSTGRYFDPMVRLVEDQLGLIVSQIVKLDVAVRIESYRDRH
jgi:hypothetical protein